MAPVLSVSGLYRSFGGNRVLDGVDFEIEGGRLFHMIGPNGCGKTTLINVVSGLLRPDAGRIVLRGVDITETGPYGTYRAGLVRTWQIPQPFVNLTALENLMVAGDGNSGESFLQAPLAWRWHGDERAVLEAAHRVIDMVGLSGQESVRGSELSGGQQKLLELGRAMMSGAGVILMDEPIAGVNPTLAREIFEKIRRICRQQKITFLIVEHRLDIALQYVDHVLAMDKGRIVAQGAPDQITKDPRVMESYLGG